MYAHNTKKRFHLVTYEKYRFLSIRLSTVYEMLQLFAASGVFDFVISGLNHATVQVVGLLHHQHYIQPLTSWLYWCNFDKNPTAQRSDIICVACQPKLFEGFHSCCCTWQRMFSPMNSYSVWPRCVEFKSIWRNRKLSIDYITVVNERE
jgi:hypothetical protein